MFDLVCVGCLLVVLLELWVGRFMLGWTGLLFCCLGGLFGLLCWFVVLCIYYYVCSFCILLHLLVFFCDCWFYCLCVV